MNTMAKPTELAEVSSQCHCDGTGIQKGPSHLYLCMGAGEHMVKSRCALYPKCTFIARGHEQISDTAYTFLSSYFSPDITQAHTKLHVNKSQNSKMHGWNKSDSLKYQQISLRLSENFMSGQERVLCSLKMWMERSLFFPDNSRKWNIR